MSAIINLFDSSNSRIIGSISASYEDPISLESFASLIESHRNSSPANTRCFILAQVSPLKDEEGNKSHKSYYSAFCLNKFIFRIQRSERFPYRRELIRINALDPLMNTEINQDIIYFLVKPPNKTIYGNTKSSVFNEVTQSANNTPNSDFRIHADYPSTEEGHDLDYEKKFQARNLDILVRNHKPLSLTNTGKLQMKVLPQKSNKKNIPEKSESAYSGDHETIDGVSLVQDPIYEAVAIGTDKNLLKSKKIKSIFIKNALPGEDIAIYQTSKGVISSSKEATLGNNISLNEISEEQQRLDLKAKLIGCLIKTFITVLLILACLLIVREILRSKVDKVKT